MHNRSGIHSLAARDDSTARVDALSSVTRAVLGKDWERFLEKVEKTDTCWIWTGRLNEKGYGWFTIKSRYVKAHRYIYEALVGLIPEGMQLDHRCHTFDISCEGGKTCRHRRCVNPKHLQLVTSLANTRRGIARARLKTLDFSKRYACWCNDAGVYHWHDREGNIVE